MSRTRVKFNALKDTELSTADTETSAKGVITFTDKRIRVGLGGDKKIDYMPTTPDNVVTLDDIQTIPSEKTFTDTLLYSSSRTIADKSNTEVVVKKDIVEHLDGYVTKDTEEVITGNKTFNGSLLKESSITSLNDLSDNEVPNKQQLLNKLSEYVEKSGFTAPINFIGEIANFSSLPSSATKGDCYYTNQPPEKKGFWLKSDTGWLNLGTGVEINLDGFANVNTPNEFTKATVFNTSIEVRDNSGSILKADTNAVVVNKPLKALSVQVNPNALEFVTKEWFEKSTQTIQGLKTFTTPPKLLSPATIAQHAVNKTYVDTMVNAMSISKGNNVVKNRPPTEADRYYKPGVLWINTGENPEIYIRTANDWYGIHSETVINCPPQTSNYPMPGEFGFGCGVAPKEVADILSMTPMDGYDDPTHENFGNYLDPFGSQMVWVPAMYVAIKSVPVKIDMHPYYGLEIKISYDRPSFVCDGPDTANRPDYTKDDQWYMPECFFDGTRQVQGIFYDKTGCGYDSTTRKYLAKKNLPYFSHNLQTMQTNLNYATRGTYIYLDNTFSHWFLTVMSLAHMQACFLKYDKKEAIEHCAWLDMKPYMPRSICNRLNRDVFDTKIATPNTVVTEHPYRSHMTHNGQKCGIVTGLENSGITRLEHTGFQWIMESQHAIIGQSKCKNLRRIKFKMRNRKNNKTINPYYSGVTRQTFYSKIGEYEAVINYNYYKCETSNYYPNTSYLRNGHLNQFFSNFGGVGLADVNNLYSRPEALFGIKDAGGGIGQRNVYGCARGFYYGFNISPYNVSSFPSANIGYIDGQGQDTSTYLNTIKMVAYHPEIPSDI